MDGTEPHSLIEWIALGLFLPVPARGLFKRDGKSVRVSGEILDVLATLIGRLGGFFTTSGPSSASGAKNRQKRQSACFDQQFAQGAGPSRQVR
jgi:hypothetical protein